MDHIGSESEIKVEKQHRKIQLYFVSKWYNFVWRPKMKYITVAEAAEKVMTAGQPEKHGNSRTAGV